MLNIKMYLKKFFSEKFAGACFPIFRVKKFWILKIALRKKKAPAKADAYFFIVKIIGYCAEVLSTTAMCRSLSCFSVTGQGD